MKKLHRQNINPSERSVRRILCCLFLLVAILPPQLSGAGFLSPYDTPLGAGDAWSVANASSGVALDKGLTGGYGNPAAFVTDRNEIYGEGSVWSAFSIQNRVAPVGISYGAGTIGYLTSYERSSLAFVYQVRSQLDRGADYGQTEVINNQNLTDMGAAYSFYLREKLTAGIYFGAVRGSGFTGTLLNSSDLDTVYTPQLWTMKFGLQHRSESLKWGVVLELPAVGTYKVERPVNVARRRNKEVYSYRGPWMVRTGVGREQENGSGYEIELLYGHAGFALRGDDRIAEEDHLVQLGISGRARIDDNLRLTSGLNFRLKDPTTQSAFLLGLGGEYALTENVLLFGGAGFYFPTGKHSQDTALDDVRPWLARGGIMFFER